MYEGDWEYAKSRLEGTVVSYNDRPVLVSSVGSDGVEINNFYNGESLGVVELGDLDFTPFKLGFVNHRGIATYLARVPKRDNWKQGMRENNVRALYGADSNTLAKRKIFDTIVGNFPSYEDACSGCAGASSIAWDRDWALSSDGEILYKYFGVVGKVEMGFPHFNPGKEYLVDRFEESKI